MDETAVELSDGKVTVIVPRDARKAVKKSTAQFSHHITLVTCIAADASPPPKPAIILPLVNYPPLSKEVTEYFEVAGSENGWIDINLWSQWIRETFIPHVSKRRDELWTKGGYDRRWAGKALLYLDAHASRIDLVAHQQLFSSGIICVSIPAHSSHILQPLDCGVHNLLKSHLRRNRMYINTESLPQYRQSVLYLLTGAHGVATNKVTVEQAFKTCGLSPWNPRRVLDDDRKVTPCDLIPPAPDKPSITVQISGTWIKPEIISKHLEEKARIAAEKEAALRAKELAKEEKAKLKEQKVAIQEAKKANRELQKAKSNLKKVIVKPVKRQVKQRISRKQVSHVGPSAPPRPTQRTKRTTVLN